MRTLFSILIAIITFSSCGTFKEKEVIYYNITSCSDPWDDYSKRNVKKYLRQNNVAAYSINEQFDDALVQTCECCCCTSGDILEISISKDDLDLALSLFGFYQ